MLLWDGCAAKALPFPLAYSCDPKQRAHPVILHFFPETRMFSPLHFCFLVSPISASGPRRPVVPSW
jgi:hypothetical protein